MEAIRYEDPIDQRMWSTSLEKLRKLRSRRASIDQEIANTVAVLRSPALDGHCLATWQEVADALGVTPQAVQQRYREMSWGGGD